MRESHGPFGDEPIETESRRLTPSVGLSRDSEQPVDSSNEDFLFHLYRGSELLQDNRVHEAKEELERALHLQPRDLKGQDLLAVVYFRLGLYPRAIHIYEQLRRRNANDTALLLNLALCYLKTGQPQLARRDLEHLLSLNPNHSRAWGYLGLACERLGDIAQAEHAFRQGGHAQMAKRMAARRGAADEVDAQPSPEVRDAAGAAYQELDAGELSFALAEPASDRSLDDVAAQSWRPHEIGQFRKGDSVGPTMLAQRPETRKPDTKDGWKLDAPGDDGVPVTPSIPQLGAPQPQGRRPTLIAPIGAPPAQERVASEFSAVERIPSYQPPSITIDDPSAMGPPSIRRTVVAVPSPFGPAKAHEPMSAQERRTLPPPLGPGSASPRVLAAAGETAAREPNAPNPPLGIGPSSARSRASSAAPPPAPEDTPQITLEKQALGDGANGQLSEPALGSVARDIAPPEASEVRFPRSGVVLHPSGVALVQIAGESGFATRLESIRAQQSGLTMKVLERQSQGKSLGESFGGIASPMVLASGDGQLVLAARPGRRLHAYRVRHEEMFFAREDNLLAFGTELSFENGRLTTGEGELVPVVQLRGEGTVLLEAIGEILPLSVHAERSLTVRREVILGWFGRLVPRALPPNEAPCGQRGLVSFAGEGRVLLASS